MVTWNLTAVMTRGCRCGGNTVTVTALVNLKCSLKTYLVDVFLFEFLHILIVERPFYFGKRKFVVRGWDTSQGPVEHKWQGQSHRTIIIWGHQHQHKAKSTTSQVLLLTRSELTEFFSFQEKWFEDFPWLHYSASLKGVLCFHCTKVFQNQTLHLWARALEIGRRLLRSFQLKQKVTPIATQLQWVHNNQALWTQSYLLLQPDKRKQDIVYWRL